MDEKLGYGASVLFGALALVLLVVNVSLINGNRHLQDDILKRQSQITAGSNLSQLNQGLVQALADASIKDNDSMIRELLSSQGITVKPNTPGKGAAAPAPTASTPATKSK